MRTGHNPPTPLPLYLSLGYALLIVYASLYPLTGWRDSGASPTDFLFAGWPRYNTVFDMATNLAAYMPLGFTLATALRRHFSAPAAIALTVLLGGGLSLALEFTQNYLPNRVASNLDLGGNTLGALLGALAGAWCGQRAIDGLRHAHWPATRRGVEAGLLLVGLWLLLQFDLTILSYGAGDLRNWLDMPSPEDFSASGFQRTEALIAASGVLAGLLLAGLVAPSRHPLRRGERLLLDRLVAQLLHQRRLFPLSLLLLGLAARTLAYALMMEPQAALAWATPGCLSGLAGGALLWLAASFVHPNAQRALAALALLAATALVNLAPTNPYLENVLQGWHPGQFLNFHGLTHFVATLWPYLTLPWLVLDHRRHFHVDR
jgi:VanZ family protein